MSGETRDALVHRIQFGGDEVVQAKDGAGSATLSMAQAGARFAGAVLDGLAGEKDVIECTFVDSPLFKDEGVDFFSTKVTLGVEVSRLSTQSVKFLTTKKLKSKKLKTL